MKSEHPKWDKLKRKVRTYIFQSPYSSYEFFQIIKYNSYIEHLFLEGVFDRNY